MCHIDRNACALLSHFKTHVFRLSSLPCFFFLLLLFDDKIGSYSARRWFVSVATVRLVTVPFPFRQQRVILTRIANSKTQHCTSMKLIDSKCAILYRMGGGQPRTSGQDWAECESISPTQNGMVNSWPLATAMRRNNNLSYVLRLRELLRVAVVLEYCVFTDPHSVD